MKSRQLKYWLQPTFLTLASVSLPVYADATHLAESSAYSAAYAIRAPLVDGIADEPVWQQSPWYALDQRWLGPEYSSEDFQGRFKIVWTKTRLYIHAEIVDDILIDTHRNPLIQYWDDDCLEIFLDEDYSGGDHQYNHNAFAYHFSLDNQAIDIGTDKRPRSYTQHTESRWQQLGNIISWELSIEIYTDAYQDDADDNQPTALYAGKIIGLMLAYCDNDGSELRENFIGSEAIAGEGKDRGWIDAGVFGKLTLVE